MDYTQHRVFEVQRRVYERLTSLAIEKHIPLDPGSPRWFDGNMTLPISVALQPTPHHSVSAILRSRVEIRGQGSCACRGLSEMERDGGLAPGVAL